MKSLMTILIADGTTVVNNATSQLRGVMTSIFDLVSVILTIICAVGLTIAIGKWAFSDHDAKDGLIKWGSAFILSIVLLSIVKLTSA